MMETSAHPFRSVLYIPGAKARALDKARNLAADALILDLEDAVTPLEKPQARALTAAAVAEGGYGNRTVLIRINGLDTEWGVEDLAAAVNSGPDAILLPKVEHASDITGLAERLEGLGAPEHTRIWAMMETPRGILHAADIAVAHDRLEGLVMGTNDLVKDLGAVHTANRQPLLASFGLCLLAARAEGLVCVDGVYNAYRDEAGLRRICVQGREMGFDGKTLIHPSQLAIANEVFSPSPDDIASAEAQIAAFDAATARGEGVAVVDGNIVEILHAEAARRLLARSAMIASLQARAE